MQKKIKILVAAHKDYKMPEDRDLYIPIHVGAEGKAKIKDFTADNTGDNISAKNPYYCELTGIYWAWKNLDADYIGLCHYRRYFTASSHIPKEESQKFKEVITKKQIENLLADVDVLLPKKRKYYIENLYSHYEHTMYVEPLQKVEGIIQKRYPEYMNEFKKLHKRTSAHMFNMFIMKKEVLNEYCEWLFNILFELENEVDITEYDAFHARFYGRISELLLDVWINTNKIQYKEIKLMDMQNVDWIKKGMSFLKAKFRGKKYEKSF